jgi:DNA polymerase-3 subunit delta'
MILITARPNYLPATILSRCQQLALAAPKEEVALQWLKEQLPDGDPEVLLHLANGAPLTALRLADPEILARRQEILKDFLGLLAQREDPIAVAGRWEKDAALTVQWLGSWIQDMLRLKAASEPPFLNNPDLKPTLKKVAEGLSIIALHRMMDRILEVNRAMDSTLNMRLVLESLLLDFTQADVA